MVAFVYNKKTGKKVTCDNNAQAELMVGGGNHVHEKPKKEKKAKKDKKDKNKKGPAAPKKESVANKEPAKKGPAKKGLTAKK